MSYMDLLNKNNRISKFWGRSSSARHTLLPSSQQLFYYSQSVSHNLNPNDPALYTNQTIFDNLHENPAATYVFPSPAP